MLAGAEPLPFFVQVSAVQANEDRTFPGSTGKAPYLCPRMIEDSLHQPCFPLSLHGYSYGSYQQVAYQDLAILLLLYMDTKMACSLSFRRDMHVLYNLQHLAEGVGSVDSTEFRITGIKTCGLS